MQKEDTLYMRIKGGKEMLDWFGMVPSFHDAEVLGLHLNRNADSRLILDGWVTSNDVDPQGYFKLEKRATVTFTFQEITDLDMEEFNQQNVIQGLELAAPKDQIGNNDRTNENGKVGLSKLTLKHCFGMSGYLCGRGLSVSFVPKLIY